MKFLQATVIYFCYEKTNSSLPCLQDPLPLIIPLAQIKLFLIKVFG